MVLWLIILCEIGFWLALFLGMTIRYVFKRPELGMYFLCLAPILDVILLVATGYDLHRGAQAEFAHGLAALYLGFTAVFGRSLVESIDRKFAFKFEGGPENLPLHGWKRAKKEWVLWFQCLIASFLAAALLQLGVWLSSSDENAQALKEWLAFMPYLIGIWFCFGPLLYSLFPKRKTNKLIGL